MTKWDIKPDGVRGVLSRTAEVGGEFEEEFTSYGEGLLGAATCAGTMVLGGTETPRGGCVRSGGSGIAGVPEPYKRRLEVSSCPDGEVHHRRAPGH
ncbi:DUF6507 family protein [Streptomyces sp. NPDC057729]|uniref:DUF6507 family protein n=1 Tax=Streptomyces sp. NPDC057729 TaxID=3346230 RepID=UPI0036896B5A